MKMRFVLLAASLLALALSCLGPVKAEAKTLHVVASFTVLGNVVKNVGGDHVVVKSLVPPNGDPHDYEPSPSDAQALDTANLTFLSGADLETWFARLVKATGYKGHPIIVSKGIKTHKMDENGKWVVDPHVWNSVPNVEIWVRNIEQAMIKADPEDKAAFAANAAAYLKKLKALDAYTRRKIDAIPRAERKVLTSHDAFGYFGRTYGVTFLAPLGVSTETEASAADMAKLIDQIKREHVKVYFVENSTSARLVEQIAHATGAKPGGELYPGALSGPDGPAPTYLKMFRHNVDLLVAAMTKNG